MRAVRRFCALTRREILSLLVMPTSYVVLSLFVIVSSLNFYIATLESGRADFGPVVLLVQFLGVFFVPLLTMRLFAEERRSGTLEILLTAPVNPVEVVLAKYVAAVVFYGLMLVPCVGYLALLAWAGDVDNGMAITGLVGLVLIGAVYAAVGLFVSSLTRSQITAAMGAVAVLLVLWSTWWLGEDSVSAGARLWRRVSIKHRFDESLAKGVLDSADVVFFASLAVFFVFCTWVAIRVSEGLGAGTGRTTPHRRRLVALVGAVAAEAGVVAAALFDIQGESLNRLLEQAGAQDYGPVLWVGVPFAVALVAAVAALWLQRVARGPGLGLLVAGVALLLLQALADPQSIWRTVTLTGLLLVLAVAAGWFFWTAVNRLAASTLVGVLAVAAILVNVNLLASRHAVRADLSEAGLHTLAPATRQALQRLQQPLRVTVLFTAQDIYKGRKLLERTRELLQEYAAISPHVLVEYIDPVMEPGRAREATEDLKVDAARLPAYCVVRYADRHVPVRWNQVLTTRKNILGEKETVFQGERIFTAAVRRLLDPRTKRVYFTVGHHEYGLYSEGDVPRTLGRFARELRRQNYHPDQVDLEAEGVVPPDCDLLVVAGPVLPFTEEEARALHRYVRDGGRLLALLETGDHRGRTPMKGWLQEYGIRLHDDLLKDPRQNLGDAESFILAAGNPKHPIVAAAGQLRCGLMEARSMGILKRKPSETWEVKPLLQSSPSARAFVYDSREKRLRASMSRGPFHTAVAAEDLAESGTRLVVVGDADLAGNFAIQREDNRLFLVSAVRWLTQREQPIAIPEKADVDRDLALTGMQQRVFWWVALVGIPQIYLVLGVAMWWVRRR